eukprot:6185350-Pleurochrysis_carterae.AAC.2
MTVGIVGGPKLADREQRITHRWHATHSGESEIDNTILGVSDRKRQVSHGDARSRLPVYTRHGRTFIKLRAWRSLRRDERVATSARGFEAMRRSVQAARVAPFSMGNATGGVAAADSFVCGRRTGLGSICGPEGTLAMLEAFVDVSAIPAGLRSGAVLHRGRKRLAFVR